MFRKLAGTAVLGLLVCASAVLADEVKGKVVKVDDAANTITISVDGKETKYDVAKDCKFDKRKGKDGKEMEMDLKAIGKMVDRAKDKGRDVKVKATTEKKDGKTMVTEIKMDMAPKKDGN